MWVVKGLSLGTVVFVVGTLFYLWAVLRPWADVAIALSAIRAYTVQNWLWWTVLFVVLSGSLTWVRFIKH